MCEYDDIFSLTLKCLISGKCDGNTVEYQKSTYIFSSLTLLSQVNGIKCNYDLMSFQQIDFILPYVRSVVDRR